MKWLAISVSMLSLFGTVSAQCVDHTTQGKDFWLMFMANHVGNSSLSLVAACDRPATITVSNPLTSWSSTVTLDSAGSVTIPIPYTQGCTEDYAVVSNGGLHVTATQPIALYASNFQIGSYDIATILPSSVLQSHYMAQTYRVTGYSEVGFVALEDSTVLSMTLPSSVEMLPAGPHSVILMQGQTYQLWGGDFSGMVVTSNNKPFAMFQGSRCTCVGIVRACDHLYEQCYPTLFWGNHFLLVPTAERTIGDLVRVTALEDSCRLSLDGVLQTTLMAGQTHQFELQADAVRFLESSRPVTTCLYLKSAECDSCLGDPATVIIPPLEQGVTSTVFQAINTLSTTQHYANIVVAACAADSMKIDGTPIGAHFHSHPSGYSYAQLPITPGIHTLTNSQHSFVTHFYGLGIYESYAYIAGSAIRDLSESLFVDTIETRSVVCRVLYCQGDTISMHIESDEERLEIEWFVDSQWVATTDTVVKHVFNSPGIHSIQARYHLCDILESSLEIMPTYSTVDVDTICFDQSYLWRGRLFDSDGFYVDSLLSQWTCDSLFALDLEVLEKPQSALITLDDCHTATYTLSANLAEADGWPFSWDSHPLDSLLDGHFTDTSVVVKPLETTLYTLDVAYRCPYSLDTLLKPIEWPGAAWEVMPNILSYAHPWFDAYDRSLYETRRQWFVDQQLQSETGSHFRYEVPLDADSVELMLVVSNNSCSDTLRCSIPFIHSIAWTPNVFVPCAEGNNRFEVVLNDAIADELLVYNRHGVLIRRLAGPNPVWDGTASDGTPCPQESYVWILRYRADTQPTSIQTLTGTVILLR